MSHTAILLIALAVLAHLVADFVLQTDAIAEAKAAEDGRAWRGLGIHAAIVGVCLLPFIAAYGVRGLEYLVVVTVAHALIDRIKVVLSLRALRARTPTAAAGAPASAGSTTETATTEAAPAASVAPPDAPDAPGDRAWTPLPAALFLADQAAHFVVLVVGASVIVLGHPTLTAWNDAVNAIAGHLLPVSHQAPALILVVILLDLAIINIRGGFFLVGTLLAPRGFAGGSESGPEQVGATIGILERLIVCVLVLTGQAAAIGFVIAAKTLARFRQLDDRHFAEYYLVGTLASVTLALATSLIATAAITAALG
jgi:Protein of unknown function (DUF3307)